MRKFYNILLILIFASCVASSQIKNEYGVYESVLRNVQGTIDQISLNLTSAAYKAGWNVITTIDAGVPEGCPYKARVIVLYEPSYLKNVMDANRKTGPFAIIDRINIFQDEQGLHLSVVNPHSISRTVLMDDSKYSEVSELHLQSLRSLIISAVKGESSKQQYGQIRDEGFIGKTMGVIAGGRFDAKIENEITIPKGDLSEIADKVEKSLTIKGTKWGTHAAYRIQLNDYETVIIGITGTPMDSKSFTIVGSGSDDSREDFKCAGLAHAGAYPLELVVTHEKNDVVIRIVDAMFRMKMYFEDAGVWAFMKNMAMPGSIEDEIINRVLPAIKQITK